MTPTSPARLTARLTARLPLLAVLALLMVALVPGCRTTHGPAGMENVEWTLIEILGTPVVVPEDGTSPTLTFDSAALMVTGTTGLNRFNGTYQTEGASVEFGAIVSTRRAGPPELMEQETLFLQALDRTQAAEVSGGALHLRSGDTVLARLTK